MELIKKLESDFVFEDQRGTLTQITHEPFAQTNAVFTKAHQVRGNFHYHCFTKVDIFDSLSNVKFHHIPLQLNFNIRDKQL